MTNQIFKLAVLGDGGSGKSSLLDAKINRNFAEDSKITIGVDIACIPFELKQLDGNDSTFLAVDLGGQERFHFIHDAYLKGVKAAIIVYDLTRYRSFLNISHWCDMVYNENPLIPVFIAGTKKDLVSEDEIKHFKQEFDEMKEGLPNNNNICGHHFISSKTLEGIDQLFSKCEEMIKFYYSLEGVIKISL